MIYAGLILEKWLTGERYQELENLPGKRLSAFGRPRRPKADDHFSDKIEILRKMSDTIATMLTSIRNASAVKHESVLVPYSKVNFGILQILNKENWLGDIEIKKRGEKQWIAVILRYNEDGSRPINAIHRVSKPGKRIYRKWKEILPVRQGQGTVILSTPSGIITGKEARKQKTGGEVLCHVW